MNLLWSSLLVWGLFIESSVAIICKNDNGECLGGDCSNAVECVNGICENDGSCSCNQCYSGPGCDNFEDHNQPYFFKDSETIYIETTRKGVIYEASARDDDNFKTCNPSLLMPCPCGKITYEIIHMDENKETFKLDSETGKLWLRDSAVLSNGDNFKLVIGFANDQKKLLRKVEKRSETLMLHIIVKDETFLEDSLMNLERSSKEKEKYKYLQKDHNSKLEGHKDTSYSDEMPELTREKRSSSGSAPGSSNFTFEILNNVVEPIMPGQSVDFQLTIILPTLTTSMDLNVEVFVMDAVSGITTFSLCNVSVGYIGSAIKDNNSQPITTSSVTTNMIINSAFLTFYDRAILNFGNVLNSATSGGTDYSDSTIIVTFTATLVSNSLFTNATAIVTAGAEYNSQNYVYVSQAAFNYTSNPTVSYPSNVTLTGPNSIPIFSAGQFDINAFITNPIGTVFMDIFTPMGTNDDYSVTSFKLISKGANFMCSVPADEIIQFYKSVSGRTNYRATMQFPILLSNLIYPPNTPSQLSNVGFLISSSFTIFVYGATPGETITIGVGLLIGTTTIWTGMMNITVSAPLALPAGTPTSVTAVALDSRTASPQVNQYQSAAWAINIAFDDTAPSNIPISCTATPGASNTICGVLYGPSGKYIGVYPNLTQNVVYDSIAGTATWAFDVNTSYIDTTITRLTGQSTLVFEVTVSYQTTTINSATVVCNGQTMTLTAALGPQPIGDVSGTVTLIGKTNKFYYGSQVGFDVTLSFPGGGVGYSGVTLETSGDFSVTTYGARVCEIRVWDIGRGVGCIASSAANFNQLITYNKSLTTSPYNDAASINFGSVCGSYLDNAKDIDRNVMFRVVYELPKPQTVSGTQFNLSVGVLLSGNMIWTGWADYVPSTAIPAINTTMPPLFTVVPPTVLTYVVEQPTFIKVYIKTFPGSVGQYKLTFTAQSSAIVSICRVVILNYGRNYACLDQYPYGKSSNANQTVTIVHSSVKWGLSAVLNFGIVNNLGTGDFYSTSIADENTIEVGLIVKGISVGTPGNILVQYDDGTPTLSQTVALTITAPPAATVPATTLTMNVTGLDGTMNFYQEYTKQLNVVLTVPPGYNSPASLEVVTTDALSLIVCFAAVTQVGLNIPCLLPKETTSNITLVPAGGATTTLNLNTICYFSLSLLPSDSVITILIGVMPKKTLTTASFVINVLEAGTQTSTQTVTLTNVGLYTPSNATLSGINLFLEDNSTVTTVEPGMRYWIGFYFQLPPQVTILAQLAVMTQSQGGRAAATVHGFRWGPNQGENIACVEPLDSYTFQLLQNASTDNIPMIRQSQNDTMIVALKYITNTGITYLQNTNQTMDDYGNIEVDIWIADNPLLATGALIPVSIAFQCNSQIVVITKNLTLSKTGTEQMVLNNSLTFTNPAYDASTSFAPGQKIGLSAILQHVPNISQVEANNATVRFLLPSYVSFANVSNPLLAAGIAGDTYYSNLTVVFYNQGYLDFYIGYLFFTDILQLNVTVTVDPYSTMPKGLGTLNSTALLRLVCKEKSYTNPTQYCGSTTYINYLVDGSDCFTDLAITSFSACQFSASTAIDSTVAPNYAATTTGWSPAVRDITTWNHYIIIDFLKLTRVTKISFNAVAGKRGVGTYQILYSSDGIMFIPPCLETLTANAGELPMGCRFQSRFAKIVILTADSADETIAVGVSFQWFGCYLSTNMSTCSLPSTPLTTQESPGWRHAAVDTVKNIIYFCDYSPKKKRMVCYSSPDGNTWNVLPSYIGSLAGFDVGTSKMYAWDTKQTALVASNDGALWTLVSPSVQASITPTTPTTIPGSAKSAFQSVSIGSYTADFDGILLAGSYKVKWNSCCT